MTDPATGAGGVAAGVPFVAFPPAGGARPGAPLVLAWHLADPPRTEAAFAAALPLAGLDAWRVFLGLPLSGSRLPAGGYEELTRLGYEDAVLNLQGPTTARAVEELGPALAELRGRLDLGDGPVGLLGGSIGAAVAQLAVAEGLLEVRAAVLVSPLVQLRPAVDAMARRFGFDYPWSGPAREVARRLDLVARAGEIAAAGAPAVLLVVGEDDDVEGFRVPAERLRAELAARCDDPGRVQLTLVPGMGHAVAEEPGTDPAPQTPHAAEVDRRAVAWLRRHLG